MEHGQGAGDRGHPVVPGFVDLALIGRGAEGSVYAARDEVSGRLLALKVVDAPVDPTVLAQQAAAWSVMAEIPHVVPVFEAVQAADGRTVLVMPLLSGSLADRIRLTGPGDGPTVAMWADQLAGALDAIHRLGIVHRDIKPANILFDPLGDAYLSDFGISATGAAGTSAVSRPHAAPERFVDPSSASRAGDIYSLASSLFAALTARAPFGLDGDGPDTGEADARRPVTFAGVSVEANRALDRGMARRPADRPASASELAAELRRGLELPATTIDEPTVNRAAYLPPSADDTLPSATVAATAGSPLPSAPIIAAVPAFGAPSTHNTPPDRSVSSHPPSSPPTTVVTDVTVARAGPPPWQGPATAPYAGAAPPPFRGAPLPSTALASTALASTPPAPVPPPFGGDVGRTEYASVVPAPYETSSNLRAVLAAAVAILVVGALLGLYLATRGGGDTVEAQVEGESIERTTTTGVRSRPTTTDSIESRTETTQPTVETTGPPATTATAPPLGDPSLGGNPAATPTTIRAVTPRPPGTTQTTTKPPVPAPTPAPSPVPAPTPTAPKPTAPAPTTPKPTTTAKPTTTVPKTTTTLPPRVDFSRGLPDPATSGHYFWVIQARNFRPNAVVQVQCVNGTSLQTFKTFTVPTDGTGSFTNQTGCSSPLNWPGRVYVGNVQSPTHPI